MKMRIGSTACCDLSRSGSLVSTDCGSSVAKRGIRTLALSYTDFAAVSGDSCANRRARRTGLGRTSNKSSAGFQLHNRATRTHGARS